MESILEIKDLKKQYKGFLLNNINFNLNRGYIMGFIGPNGAGKSTTIKLIMNLIKKDSGEIKVFGLDNIKSERDIKQRIGFVYDENYYYDELTTEEMKRIIASFYKNWDDELYNKYTKEFVINRKSKIKELSKGMKMKFSLALALSHQAEFIIMDEPTSGLDPVFRNEILDILLDVIQDENNSILFSSHITTDLDKIADYVTFINNGEIVLSDEKEKIFEHYSVIKGDKEILNDNIKNKLIGLRNNKYGFEALTTDAMEMRELLKGRASFEEATLEDIMLYTVRGSKNV